MMNRVLPNDIRVVGWCPVPDHFSARFSCSYRLYRYYFTKRQMDLELMRTGGNHLVGQHDYRNFCKMDVVNVRKYDRELLSFTIAPATPPTNSPEDVYYFEFKGRCMAVCLFVCLFVLSSNPTCVCVFNTLTKSS